MDNNIDLYGISRIDHKHTHSWWVRLNYINKKPQFQKSFSDKKHGGKDKSFAAAVMYRDKMVLLHNLLSSAKLLSWKNRTSKEMKLTQKKYGKRLVKVGTGIEGAKKAYGLGMGRVTCFKVRTGRQDCVTVNNGGWQTPDYEDFGFKHDISLKEYKEIRNSVEHYARDFSEAEKSEMVSDIMLKFSTGMIEKTKPINGVVNKWVIHRKRKKNCPSKRMSPLDINGNIIPRKELLNGK